MRWLIWLLAGMGSFVVGCGASEPEPPRTYPVTGRVVYPDGTPMKDEFVQFTATTESTPNAVGDIGPDGKFSLRTVFRSKRLTGAAEGKYEVTIQAAIGPDRRVVPSCTLPEPIEVKPGRNEDLTLTSSAPRPTSP